MTDLYTDALEPKVLKLYHELPRLLTHWKLRPMVKQYACYEDALGDAAVGIMTAASKFDANRGFTFLTFAYWHIRSELQRGLARNGGKSVIGYASNKYTKAYGTSGLPRTCSGWWDHQDEDQAIVSEMLATYDDGPSIVDAHDEYNHYTFNISQRDLQITLERFGHDKSQTQVGDRHNISKERVRQLVNRTVSVIRERAAEVGMGVGA